VDTGVASVFIPVADSTALPQTGAAGVVPLGAAGLGLLLAGAGLRTAGVRRRGRTG
jgi:LPXTG-motif cell wall-anchored protein